MKKSMNGGAKGKKSFLTETASAYATPSRTVVTKGLAPLSSKKAGPRKMGKK